MFTRTVSAVRGNRPSPLVDPRNGLPPLIRIPRIGVKTRAPSTAALQTLFSRSSANPPHCRITLGNRAARQDTGAARPQNDTPRIRTSPLVRRTRRAGHQQAPRHRSRVGTPAAVAADWARAAAPGREHDDHADAEIEHVPHFREGHMASIRDRAEEARRPRPRGGIHARLAPLGQHAHQVACDSTAGDVRHPMQVAECGRDGGVVAPMHRKECVRDGDLGARNHVGQAEPHDVEQHMPCEGVTIGVQTRRCVRK